MDLGINKVVNDGNGNTLLYTALLAAAIANTLPTPFDAIYFRRVNKLQRDYDEDKITPENLEWHVAGEYYLWTSLWYVALFTGIYAFGGKYKTNARILLALAAGGFVLGAVNKNIEVNKEVKKRQLQGKSSNQSFTGFNEETYWNDAFNTYDDFLPTDNVKDNKRSK
jgi:hypothetical protein